MRALPLLLILTTVACKRSPAPDTDPAVAGSPMNELTGTWKYAEDPLGEVGTDPLYATSTITFGADGSYRFQLEDGGMALTGTWTLREPTDEGYLVATDYGGGRTNLLHLAVRRTDGQAAGFVVREGEGRIGGRYYTR
jgi:hypothetical protein